VIEPSRGDAGGLCCAPPQLHEPRHASRMDSGILSYRRPEGEDVSAPRAGGDPREFAGGTDIPFIGGSGTIEFTIPES